MNEPKGGIREDADQPEDEAGGHPTGGGPLDKTMGGTDNTTAESVEEAKEAAELKRQRG
jgi:hypothetical protein